MNILSCMSSAAESGSYQELLLAALVGCRTDRNTSNFLFQKLYSLQKTLQICMIVLGYSVFLVALAVLNNNYSLFQKHDGCSPGVTRET